MAGATSPESDAVVRALWGDGDGVLSRLAAINHHARRQIAAGDVDAASFAIALLAETPKPAALPPFHRSAVRRLKNIWMVELMQLAADQAATRHAARARALILRARRL